MAEIDWELTEGLACNMIELLGRSMADREGLDPAHIAKQVLAAPAWAMAFQLAAFMEDATREGTAASAKAMEIVNEAISRAGLNYRLTPLSLSLS
jgi:hypothetical protein